MTIFDVKPGSGRRALALNSKEKLSSTQIIRALIKQGHSKAVAQQITNFFFDSLEEMSPAHATL